jgi:hypothetical protein
MTATSTATTHRRDTFDLHRTLRRELAQKNAALAIGAITTGMECFCLTSGQFNLVDAVSHCLDGTGPADAVISTWTAGTSDIAFAYKLMTSGLIRNMRFVVDFSFGPRQPAYLAALRQTFGDQCIAVTKNHAKFVLLTNDSWNIVIRSSMNLNEARRMETLEISDDQGLASFLQTFVDDAFKAQPPGALDLKPIAHLKAFEQMVSPDAIPNEDAILKRRDVQVFYSQEPFGNDLSRAGLTYLKGKQ